MINTIFPEAYSAEYAELQEAIRKDAEVSAPSRTERAMQIINRLDEIDEDSFEAHLLEMELIGISNDWESEAEHDREIRDWYSD